MALVLNPKTGLVSPQFHVVFDNDFTTVPHLRKGTVPPNWAKLVANSREKSTNEFYDLSKTWFEPIPDESADEMVGATSTSNEGDLEGKDSSSVQSSDSTVITSNRSEGGAPPVAVTQYSEGELPTITQYSGSIEPK